MRQATKLDEFITVYLNKSDFNNLANRRIRLITVLPLMTWSATTAGAIS